MPQIHTLTDRSADSNLPIHPPNSDLLLEIQDLKVQFVLDEGIVHAVNGLDLAVYRGQAVGIVGESGCGKSVTAQAIMRIVPKPGDIVSGHLFYHRQQESNGRLVEDTRDLARLDANSKEMRDIRGNEIVMVFQEPMSSLAPVYTIGQQIMEAVKLHQHSSKREARQRTLEILQKVGMPQPIQTIDSYPHQLSGGMRQRGMIAMALSCNPTLLIADEPTTALDVTTQGQILELMGDLQRELGMAIIFITHDLGVIAKMTEYVVVMYLGQVVESADVDTIFHNPQHPYTRALLRSMPRIGQKVERLEAVTGMVPDPFNVPAGCPFHPRCEEFQAGRCDAELPPWIETETGHGVRCVLYE